MRLMVVVEIGDRPADGSSYSEQGWERLLDALDDADIGAAVEDAVVDALLATLPAGFALPEVRAQREDEILALTLETQAAKTEVRR